MRAGRRQVWLGASVAGGVLMLALGVWALFFRSDSSRSIRRSVPIASLPAGRRPADLKVALLFDCYEHALENVPPRWDTSSRQRNWKAPPPPLPLLKSALNGSEPKLLSWMQTWDEDLRKGIQTVPQELPELEGLLRETALPFDVLFKFGLAVSFLDGDAHAACWFRAAVGRAEQECKGIAPSDPRAQSLLQALPQMAVLWRLGDYAALERRFTLERTLYPPSSADSRRAGHMRAETRYYQYKFQEAADEIDSVADENSRCGDLSASDWREVHWVQGLLSCYARRDAAAIPHLKLIAADQTDGHSRQAAANLIVSLSRARRTAEAETWLRTYVARYRPASDEIKRLLDTIGEYKNANN